MAKTREEGAARGPAERVERPRRRDAGRPRGAPVEEAVLMRAIEDLANHGLEGLSVDRIAAAAEVNKTSIYRRWPTRGALVAAALERVHEGITMRLEDHGSLRADLLSLATMVAELLSSPVGLALARAAVAEPRSNEIAAVARARLEAQAVAPMLAMVERARRRGEWRDGVAPGPLLAMLVGGLLHRALLEQAKATPELIEGIVDILLRGASPPARPERAQVTHMTGNEPDM